MLRKTTKMNSIRLGNKGYAYRGLKTALAGLLLGGTFAATGCDAPASKEDLNPEGPPMVRQIFMNEKVITASGSSQLRKLQLAFGEHPDPIFEDDDKQVLTAAIRGTQEIRIILDEQIRGNALEEMECANGSFSRIPDGTTPDDIADCSGPIDSLQNCKIALCVDADGKPIGVLDANEDGGADNLRMINYGDEANPELGVKIVCGGVSVPLNQNLSFWNPSGNQTISSNPALAAKGLGPVIVVQPEAGFGMPGGVSCTVEFNDAVTDYEGNKVCAPAGGLVANGCANGDTTQIAFGTEAVAIDRSNPKDGDVNVAVTQRIGATFNANMDVATVGAISLTAGGVDVAITATVADDDRASLTVGVEGDLLENTEYVLTIGTGFHDSFGSGLPQEETITFTTGAAPILPDAGDFDAAAPDAGTPDAA